MMSRRERKALVKDLSKRPRRRPWMALANYLISCLVLWIALIPTRSLVITSWIGVPIAAALVLVVGWALRPLLIRLAMMFSWLGAILLALFFNACVMYVALILAPGIEDTGFGSVFLAAWLYVILFSIVHWFLASDSEEVFLTYLTRRASRKEFAAALTPAELAALQSGEPIPDGLIMVQIDGLPAPVLEWGVKSGNFPNLARWIRSGEMAWSEWTVRIPSTTPASQAGLLHGDNFDIPAFRWFEKDAGKLIVANHPPDAAEIERRITNGRGLLADNGVSISNLFSGDATESILVMSKLRSSTNPRASSSYASFFTHPAGFARAIVVSIGEMGKEVFQARKQRTRGVEPRIHRGGSFIFLRGITNVLLRDLNTSLVVQSMMRGVRSVYVDYVDYDEIAHHAGVVRPESLRALEGIDKVLGQLMRIAPYTPRRYHLVCVSDHGQSQGATFSQRYGEPLEKLINDHMGAGATAAAATGTVEDWGPVNAFLSELQTHRSMSGGVTRRVLRNRNADGVVALGPTGEEHADASNIDDAQAHDAVVIGSGNLGGVWFTGHGNRLTAEDIEEHWPGMLETLAGHPGVSFVVVATERDGPVAIGRNGLHRLLSDEVEGIDPLAPFGPEAREDFLCASRFPHAPDIYLNSMYDPRSDEVAAFEELVGCHGGLGGWQTRAVLIHPSDLPIGSDLLNAQGDLVGSENVHRQLVRWLESLGHRAEIKPVPLEGGQDGQAPELGQVVRRGVPQGRFRTADRPVSE